jgi:hypothetical protein
MRLTIIYNMMYYESNFENQRLQCSKSVLPYKNSQSQKVMHTYDGDIFDVPYTPCKTDKIKCLCGGHVPPFPHLLECKLILVLISVRG